MCAHRFRNAFWGLAFFTFFAVVAPVRGGSTSFVNDNAPPGGDGQTWATAYTYLQDALSAARNPTSAITEIWVAAGTYLPDHDAADPTGTGDRTASFQLIDGVAIRGGFAGNEDLLTFDLGQRDLQTNVSVLSGDLAHNDPTTRTDDSYHVVMANSVDTTAVIDGFTISNGLANGSSSNGYGAGFYLSGSNPTILNCAFTGNLANQNGGGMYNTNSSPSLTNCTFKNNVSNYFGGGVFNASGSNPTFTNCNFGSNGSLTGGDAVYNDAGSRPVFTSCNFTGDVAHEEAIVQNNSSNAEFTNCTFTGFYSSQFGAPQFGAPVMGNNNSNPTLINCIFTKNNSGTIAGIVNNASSPTLIQCTLSGNVGGAMSNASGSNPTLINCTISGNIGWGVISTSSNPILTNSIVWGNGWGNGDGAQINGTATKQCSGPRGHSCRS